MAQTATQDRLDVDLSVGAVGIVVDAGALRPARASPQAQQRAALEQGGGPGQHVAAVAIAGGIDAAQVDVGADVRGGERQVIQCESASARARPYTPRLMAARLLE